MKKAAASLVPTKKELSLKRERIKTLSVEDLKRVAGGGRTNIGEH